MKARVSTSQFIDDEILLLPDAFNALRDNFKSREGFEVEYRRIPDALKIRFLRLASTYRNLVKDGNFSVPLEALPTSNFNYYDLTYKYVALISIIEATMGKDEWLGFYDWLKHTKVVSIKNKTELDDLYEKYKSEYGVIRNIVKFFQTLDEEEQEFLKTKLVQYRVDKRKAVKITSEINDLANLLYDIRSDFVHGARLIIEFGGIPAVTGNHKKGKPFTSNLSLNQLMRIFERSFIRHFGMRAERKTSLF